MKTYICNICGHIDRVEVFGDFVVCPNCKASFENLKLIEDQMAENEIDAIVDSVIEDVMEIKDGKIVNINEKDKFIVFDEEKSFVIRNTEKCINCGQCKKICENIPFLKYDLNKCKRPICIGCGECIVNCPSKALSYKHDYVEVKDIIDKNEKIVIAIVEPTFPIVLAEKLDISKENIEAKFVEALKVIGFDYTFNGGFANDLSILEEVGEFAERLKSKKLLPMISVDTPSAVKYIQIYHPELLNNLSTCKESLEMMAEITKSYFCEKKGFSPEKIVTVGISTDLSKKMHSIEEGCKLDYVLTLDEVINMFDREELDVESFVGKEYEEFNERSSSSIIYDIPGGKSEIFVKSFAQLINKSKKYEIKLQNDMFRNVDSSRYYNIKIGDYELRIAILSCIEDLESLLKNDKYKNYHYIETKVTPNGILNAGGFDHKNKFNISNVLTYIYSQVDTNKIKNPFDNKELKKLYKEYYGKPLDKRALEQLHSTYKSEENLLDLQEL